MRKKTFSDKCCEIGIYDCYRYVAKMYKSGKSCNEIAEIFLNEYNIKISDRHLATEIKKIMPLRTPAEHKKLAIKTGRMVYLKKPDNEKYKRTGLSQKIRMLVLKRDNFQCQICGNSPKNGYSIEVHHINGGKNDLDNLQTLCFQCHRGLHYTK